MPRTTGPTRPPRIGATGSRCTAGTWSTSRPPNRRGELSYELGENQFTDLTSDEFLTAHTMPPGQVLAAREAVARLLINSTRAGAGLVAEGGAGGGNGSYSGDAFGQVPYSVDWRTSGAVTPVKHQMTCGE